MTRIYTIEEQRTWVNSLPAKACGAAVLIFDRDDNMLIVKPNYRDHWTWPGGVVDTNESPADAAIREAKEELGIDLTNKLTFAYIRYELAHDGFNDLVHFIFTTPVVEQKSFLSQLVLEKKELDDAQFVAVDELDKYLPVGRAKTVKAYVQQGRKPLYIENDDEAINIL